MSQYYVGEIRLFAGNYAPEGDWMKCEGQLLQIQQYQMLYSLIGVTYGGDGVATFALPDFRGRIPVGQGQGTGLTQRVLGQKSGTETVTLNASQWATHNHTFNTVASPATTGTLTAGGTTQVYAQGANTARSYLSNAATNPASTTLDAVSYGSAGGSQPHNNMMPSQALTYIIATGGMYPIRS